MTKPFHPVDNQETEKKIILTLEDFLRKTGGFEITRYPYRMVTLDRNFWEEFYRQTREREFFKPMIEDLLALPKNPLIIFYSGENVTQRIINKLGSTIIKENLGQDTIRGIYGIPNDPNWRNVAHAPKPDEVGEQLKILRKYRLI